VKILRFQSVVISTFEMNFKLGDKLYIIVTKFNGYPQIQFKNCIVKKGVVIPTRVGINLILPQYAKLKSACADLLEHSDLNEPCEKDLGFGLTTRNKLCMVNNKTIRKVVFFNDRTCGSFEIGIPEFKKWSESQDQIEEAIAEIKVEIAAEKETKESDDHADFTRADVASVENYFIHLCALLARRAVNPCFPCLACHKNLPWEESANHTCIFDERAELQSKAMVEIENLLKFKQLLQKKFNCIVCLYYKQLVCDQDKLFDTFFTAFLKTLSGRQLIFDVVTSSVSGDFFASNPKLSLMGELAYIVLDEFTSNPE